MSNYTEHYNLKKPLKTESYDVDVANTNNDIIDEKLYEKADKIPGKGMSSNDFTDNYKQKLDMLQNIYKFKGSVANLTKLNEITGAKQGDVYNVTEENKNYAYSGTGWVALGTAVDLSEVVTFDDLNNKETEIKNELVAEINSHIEHKYFLQLTTAVDKGGTITLPCYYKVGTHCLDVYYMGELLTLSSDDAGTDGHYREVGQTNAVSNQIKTTSDWGCDVGEYFEFVVRGEYSNV